MRINIFRGPLGVKHFQLYTAFEQEKLLRNKIFHVKAVGSQSA